MLAAMSDAHVKDMGWAICGSSSFSPAQEVTIDMKFRHTRMLILLAMLNGTHCAVNLTRSHMTFTVHKITNQSVDKRHNYSSTNTTLGQVINWVRLKKLTSSTKFISTFSKCPVWQNAATLQPKKARKTSDIMITSIHFINHISLLIYSNAIHVQSYS